MPRKNFPQLFLLGLAMFSLLTGFTPGRARDESSSTKIDAGAIPSAEEMEDFVDKFLQEKMPPAHVPGLVVVVVKDGNLLFSKGYGFADLGQKTPMTSKTNLRVGSVSKPVLATAVMQLVEQGLVDPEVPVSQYIQDLDLTDKYGPASTAAQLLTQRGGYTDDILLSHSATMDGWQPLGEYLAGNLPRREIRPGVMSYSSWNYALLGDLIEKVTGLPYDQAVARSLFQPLGMPGTTFTQPLPDEILTKLATGYSYQDGEYKVIPLDFVRLSPGIALVTNGEDMGRFMQMLLNDGKIDGKQVLEGKTVQTLLTRQASAHPNSRGRSYAFSEINFNGRKVLYHSGNGIGFANEIILSPENSAGIFVSVNHRMLDRALADYTPAAGVMRELDTAILSKIVPESPSTATLLKPLPDAALRTHRYVGHYQTADASMHNFTQIAAALNYVDVWDNMNGTITIFGTPLVEVEPLVFQDTKNPDFFVIFIESAKGDIEYLTLGGTGAYRKSAWFESLNFTGLLLAVIGVIFLSYLLTWPFLRHGHWLAWVVSLLSLIFLAGFAILVMKTDLMPLYKTIPLMWGIILILPWFILAAVVGLATVLFLKLSTTSLPLWGKIHSSLVAAGAMVFLWFVYYWNLFLK